MPKIGEVLKIRGIKQVEFAEKIKTDESNMSRFVGGRVLPNRRTLTLMCDLLDVLPTDLYDRHEIDLLAVRMEKRKPLEPGTYKLSVRIPREWLELLDERKLKACGYDSITDWIRACLGRLKKQYEAVEKWKKERRSYEKARKEVSENQKRADS